VEKGGALFLIADHRPFGAATAASVTGAFGVESRTATSRMPSTRCPTCRDRTSCSSRARTGFWERIRSSTGAARPNGSRAVVTFGGQALEAGSATVLLRFGPDAKIHSAPGAPDDRVEPIGGRAQLVALERGKGRVVIAVEAGLFASGRRSAARTQSAPACPTRSASG
jgi:hypothetical protein